MIRSQRAILLLLIFFFITAIHAFIPLQQNPSRHHRKHNLAFFDGWFGFNNNDPQEPSDSDSGKDVDVDGIYTGSKRIITIPGE
jgi:hypothetical protein